MSRTPPLGRVIRDAIAAGLAEVHTAIPARVESYDATRRAVSVQPLIRRGYLDEEGERAVKRLPVVNDVPVVFPGITIPIAKGDTVLLVFSEASLDKWLDRGGDVDPDIDHRFHLADAIAIPGLNDFRNVEAAHASAVVVPADSELKLGSKDADDPVARKSDLDELKNIIASWTPVASDGGASLKTTITAGVGGVGPWTPSGSSKVKAD